MRSRAALAFAFLAYFILLLPTAMRAQADAQQDDVAEAARKAREKKVPRAKKVITDDDDSGQIKKTDFPALKLEGSNNSGDIVAKIKDYKGTHTPQETEAAVHAWFDQNADKLRQLVQEVRDLAERELRRGGSEDSEESGARIHAAQQDHARMREDLAKAQRIQSDLKNVVMSLRSLSMEYDLPVPEINVDDVVEE